MMTSTREAEVLAFLGGPAAFGEPAGTAVEMIETHAARVFLCGTQAFKIKRPVTLPYLDFSTLERRGKAIAREFEINRSAAPELYRSVRRIARDQSGRLALDGPGETIEWVLAMRRFDGEALLARVAETGRLDDRLAAALAEMAHASHARAEISTDGAGVGRFATIIDDIAETCLECDVPTIATMGAALRRAAAARLEAATGLLEARAGEGFRRRCHGDLHLGNIVLWQGRPVPFDAIEFDEALATVDILYDLAFMLMDLGHRGLTRAATIVLNRYLRLDDHRNLDALGLLPLFLGIRAGIRAMVAVERAQLASGTAADGDLDNAHRYLETALGSLNPPPARLVAVGGLSGTGKSSLAAALAPGLGARPGALHLRSDVERKRLCGVGETDRLPEAGYREEVTARVYQSLADQARRALAAGHSVVIDAVHARPEERRSAERVAAAAGVSFVGLWLDAPPATMTARVEARHGDASDADAGVVRRQLGYDVGPIDWARLNADRPLADVLAEASRHIGVRGWQTEEAHVR